MASSATAVLGDDFEVDFSFTSLGTTTLTDPPGVKIVHRLPNLTEVVYTYPTDTQITKLGVGSYKYTNRATVEKTHVIRPVGSGIAVNKAQEVFLTVTGTFFLNPLPT